MFLNYIKDFSVKRILKNSLQNSRSNPDSSTIKTVGLVVDESYFLETNTLLKSLLSQGILESNIEVLIYNDKFKKNKRQSFPACSASNLRWNATVDSNIVNNFIAQEFDLLISYYDVEKAVLLLVTHQSKAKFKVGFTAIDKRLNDLMINTNAENHIVFTHEIFRYLKILNKL
jgi:hypothetical protein